MKKVVFVVKTNKGYVYTNRLGKISFNEDILLADKFEENDDELLQLAIDKTLRLHKRVMNAKVKDPLTLIVVEQHSVQFTNEGTVKVLVKPKPPSGTEVKQGEEILRDDGVLVKLIHFNKVEDEEDYDIAIEYPWGYFAYVDIGALPELEIKEGKLVYK